MQAIYITGFCIELMCRQIGPETLHTYTLAILRSEIVFHGVHKYQSYSRTSVILADDQLQNFSIFGWIALGCVGFRRRGNDADNATKDHVLLSRKKNLSIEVLNLLQTMANLYR